MTKKLSYLDIFGVGGFGKEDAKAKNRCLKKFMQVNIAVLLICELTDKLFAKAISS